MDIINILTIISINILIVLSFYKKVTILNLSTILILVIFFVGINFYNKSFTNQIIIFIILLFSISIIILNVFLKLSPINNQVNNFEIIKKIRVLILKIIFPTLITIFQIVLISDSKLQHEILADKKQNTIKAVN